MIAMYYYRARYYDPEIGRFISEDPLGFAAGVNFYTYVGNNPINRNDPSGKLFANILNGFSRNPVPQQDLTRITNFTNAVGLGGAGIAAAPPLAGLVAGVAPVLGEVSALGSSTALTSGLVSGTTSALGTLATGGNTEQVLINGVAGFTAGLFVPGIKVQGFTGNFLKGAGLGGAADAGAQSFNILSDPNKSFSSDFNVGEFFGSSLGSGFTLGLTAPFGNSIPDQVSAGIFGFGPTTAFTAVGSALGQPSASGGFVLYPSKPNTNTLRSVYAK